MSTSTLADRMIFVIHTTTQEHRRFKELEQKTGLGADRWKAFAAGRQRPTAEMIEAICKLNPSWVEWLTTGSTTEKIQVDPSNSPAKNAGVSAIGLETNRAKKLVDNDLQNIQMDNASLISLISKPYDSWTSNEHLRAMYACMSAGPAGNHNSVALQILQIGLIGKAKNLSLNEAIEWHRNDYVSNSAPEIAMSNFEKAKDFLEVKTP